jgi:hypothetical protein
MSNLTIRMPSGTLQTFIGRDAWALGRLIEVGARGVTTLTHPAPRWSQYIFRLRRAGLVISTEYERHSGPFPGSHGRYRLETQVTVVPNEVAA